MHKCILWLWKMSDYLIEGVTFDIFAAYHSAFLFSVIVDPQLILTRGSNVVLDRSLKTHGTFITWQQRLDSAINCIIIILQYAVKRQVLKHLHRLTEVDKGHSTLMLFRPEASLSLRFPPPMLKPSTTATLRPMAWSPRCLFSFGIWDIGYDRKHESICGWSDTNIIM